MSVNLKAGTISTSMFTCTKDLIQKPQLRRASHLPLNNEILPLNYTFNLRLVRLNFDSPRLQEAMLKLGLVRQDLNTKMTREHFITDAAAQNGSTQVTDEVVDLRF